MRSARTAGLRLFALCCLALLLPVLVFGVVLHRTYSHDARERMFRDAEAQSQVLAQSAVLPLIADQDLARGLDLAATADLGAAVSGAAREQRVVLVRVLDVAGTPVFTSAELPSGGGVPAGLEDARRGVASSRLLDLDGPEARVLGYHGQAVQVVVPLETPADGRVIGELEVRLPYAQLARALEHQQRSFALQLVLLLGILYVFIAAITWAVTGRLRVQAERTEHQSLHDPLTALPNRKLLRYEAEAALVQSDRTGEPCALVVADLNRFKEVNDGLGHHVGDLLLVEVARRIRARLRTDDVVARLGGDEFGVVMPRTSAEDAVRVLQDVRSAVRAPVMLADTKVEVDISIGVAVHPEHGGSVETLLQNADIAMYDAKARSGAVVTYTEEVGLANRRRLGIAAGLRLAVERPVDAGTDGESGGLVVYYQSKVGAVSGRTEGVEALVRWQHPDLGLLSPADFLPLAEETGLVDDLTRWVLRRAVRDLRGLDPADRGDRRHGLTVSVNVSARTLTNPELPDLVLGVLAEEGVAADRLCVEMTETAVVSDVAVVAANLRRLREAGVGASLDDFGSGNTALAYLRSLPLTEVKIDRAFVSRLLESHVDAEVVGAVVQLAHRVGLVVVAEGVETEMQLSALRGLGVDEVQGYLFGRPVPWEELRERLEPAGPPVPALAGDRVQVPG